MIPGLAVHVMLALEAAAKKPKPKGIDLGDNYVIEDGKIKRNPHKEAKLPRPVQYAKKNRKRFKGGRKP